MKRYVFVAVLLLLGWGMSTQISAYIVEITPYYSFSPDCPKETPFISDTTHECVGCDAREELFVRQGRIHDFDICENRHNIKNNWGGFISILNNTPTDVKDIHTSVSDLKKCPSTYPIKAVGRCTTCDDLNTFAIPYMEGREICPNREVYQEDSHGIRYLRLKQCPEEAPLRGDHNCLTCDTDYWTDDPKEVCEKCPNRHFVDKEKIVFVGAKDGKRWIKKTTHAGCYPISKEKPLFKIDLEDEVIENQITEHSKNKEIIQTVKLEMRCSDAPQYICQHKIWFRSDCNELQDIETLPEICALCPNREYKDGKCIFVKCSEDTVSLEDGSCKSCDDTGSWPSEAMCRQCPEKYFLPYSNSSTGRCLSFCDYIFAKRTGISAEDCDRCPDSTYDTKQKACWRKYEKPKRDYIILDDGMVIQAIGEPGK